MPGVKIPGRWIPGKRGAGLRSDQSHCVTDGMAAHERTGLESLSRAAQAVSNLPVTGRRHSLDTRPRIFRLSYSDKVSVNTFDGLFPRPMICTVLGPAVNLNASALPFTVMELSDAFFIKTETSVLFTSTFGVVPNPEPETVKVLCPSNAAEVIATV